MQNKKEILRPIEFNQSEILVRRGIDYEVARQLEVDRSERAYLEATVPALESKLV